MRTEKETVKTYLKLVGFRLGDEEYAVDILKIKEIKLLMDITRVPKAPGFVEGVINLRGDIVPIIDLRKKLGLEVKPMGEDSRIIIVEIDHKMCGVIVDGVSEVIEIEESKIFPAPPMVKGIDADYLKGVGKQDDRILILLDLDKILTTREKAQIDQLDAAHADPRAKGHV